MEPSRTDRVLALSDANFRNLSRGGWCGTSACTWLQLSYWRDSETLWNHTIAVTSNNDLAHAYLADLLLRQNRIEEAGMQAEEALQIRPDNSYAQNNLALALFRSGRLLEAVEHWKRS
jgi:Flp pilus assembly protein TadD